MTPARDAATGRDIAIDGLTAKVSDHSTVLQALQVDIRHMTKTMDHLASVADKQAELAGELRRNSESIERAFQRTDSVESKLVQAIEKLADALQKDRDTTKEIGDTVVGYRGSVKALTWVSGGIWALILIIGGMHVSSENKDQTRTDNDIALLRANMESRKQAVDIKIDALSQQVQEVRLDRQRDRESEQTP